jgi:hypothetical protein
MKHLSRMAAICGVAITLVACGGGGGGSSSPPTTTPPPQPPPPTGGPPTGQVVFPPPLSLTDRSTVRVRGTASGDAAISSVLVNTTTATLSPSGNNATWQAQISLAPEATTSFDIKITDAQSRQNANPIVGEVRHRQYVQVPTTFAYDPVARRAYAFVGATGQLVGIDLDTGAGEVAGTVGSFFHGGSPFSLLAFDVAGARAIGAAFDSTAGRLGVFGIPAGGGTASERTFDDPTLAGFRLRDIAIAAAGDALFVLLSKTPDSAETLIQRITLPADLQNAARSVLSSNSVGTGAHLNASRGLTHDGTRLLVLDGPFGAEAGGSIIAVALDTGNRTTVLDAPSTFVAPFRSSANIDVDAAANRLYLTGIDHVLRIDLAGGNSVTHLSPAAPNAGFQIVQPRTSVLDLANNRLLVGDWETQVIGAVNLTTGSRSEHLGIGLGSGPRMREPAALKVDSADQRVFIFDTGGNAREAVIEVDLRDANRRTVSDVAQPAVFQNVGAIVLDAASNRLLTLFIDRLIEVNLANEVATVVSSSDVGTGPTFSTALGLAHDAANNRALVVNASPAALISIDLATGNRTVISGGGAGSGVPFVVPFDLALDAAGNRVLVLDRGRGELLAVNLANGARSVLRGSCVVDGVEHLAANNPRLLKLAFDPPRNRVLVTASRMLIVDLGANTCTAQGDFSTRVLLDIYVDGDGRVFATSYNMLLAVDPTNGDYVILSK